MKRLLLGLCRFIAIFSTIFSLLAISSAQHAHTKNGFASDMHAGMAVMMKEMESAPMTGDPDKDFLAMMIPHHEGAVEMARLVLCSDVCRPARGLRKYSPSDYRGLAQLHRANYLERNRGAAFGTSPGEED